jgi:hypothetical protein
MPDREAILRMADSILCFLSCSVALGGAMCVGESKSLRQALVSRNERASCVARAKVSWACADDAARRLRYPPARHESFFQIQEVRLIMDEQTAATTKTIPIPPAAAKAAQDLSSEIEQAVVRQPLDRVRCVHLYDNHYRCNWWAPGIDEKHGGQAEWALLAMHRVRKSRFITAHLSGAGELVMDEATTNN